MNINKYKILIIVVYILTFLTITNIGFCQSYSVLDLDKVEATKLPENQKEESIHEGMLSFNEVLRIKAKTITSYTFDYIPSNQFINIINGNALVNLDRKISLYNLESGAIISDVSKTNGNQYDVFTFQKKEQTESLFGISYNLIDYLASINQKTGDTLWLKQEEYLNIHQSMTVSYVDNIKDKFIIDNKTGEKLIKLNSTKSFSISDAKEDNGYLYLMSSGISESELIAINLKESKVIWKVKGKFNKFFFDDSRIYTSNQCAIDKRTGKLVWDNSSDIWIVGIVGDYLIGYLYGEDDPEIFVYNKNTGKLVGYLWSDKEFCSSCLGYESCNPEFIFAEQGEGNKTAALVKCSDSVYLCIFELVE